MPGKLTTIGCHNLIFVARTRDVVKLSLATLEEVGLAMKESDAFKPALVYDEKGDKMDRFKVIESQLRIF